MVAYFEASIGKATSGKAFEMGRKAASEALSQIDQFQPSLALAFVSPELDIPEVNRGLLDVLEDCPLIGTSTAGEIANGFIKHSVVVALLCSPHLTVRLGMGKGVSKDFQRATHKALADANIAEYFSSKYPEHQMLNVSASGALGVSPVLLLVFSPGATKTSFSLTHDIHTLLRKSSSNRVPIFGGSSGDYFQYGPNYQMVNQNVSTDAVALAFLETEILFGLGMSHGFSPTTKRALVTKASDHTVHEFDHRPAAEVYAEMLGIPVGRIRENLPAPPSPLNEFPFGSIDVYGNSLLHVPERILNDGSIQFPHLIGNDRVMTLMKADEKEIVKAGLSAYEKAVRYGGLNKPSLVMMFSCALRLTGGDDQEEIRLVRERANLPICGFYTYGELGVFDDGLPVYNNQSVSTLVFSDELNPVASLMHQSKRIYHEFKSRLDRKASQIKSISKINQIIQDGTDVGLLLTALTVELADLFSWAHGAFYLPTDESDTYSVASASDLGEFPKRIRADEKSSEHTFFYLDSPGKRFGVMVLKQRSGRPTPVEEDMVLAETIGRLTATGLHRIELDGQLDVKLQQLEILNQVGHELSKSTSKSTQLQNVVKHIRRILNLPYASLWLVDRTRHLLVKEAIDGDSDFTIGRVEKENDERLTRWQIENKRPFFFTKASEDRQPFELVPPFPFSFVTIPVFYKKQLRGVLNLYSRQHLKWSLQHKRIFENMEFLQSISTQIAIFVENRSLNKNATFYKEIHHRVKNNLQNIASLLRMQMRRLDRVTAEQALSDSISRIISIALVHETLSQEEIGMVDLGRLLGSISKLPESDSMAKYVTTLDVSGPPVLIPSREATSLALVINELVQNAVQHGFCDREEGKLALKVDHKNGKVSITVQDNGPGLPPGFEAEKDGNLGLTIVRTLIEDELKGQFTIKEDRGTQAEVTFPLPGHYYPMQ